MKFRKGSGRWHKELKIQFQKARVGWFRRISLWSAVLHLHYLAIPSKLLFFYFL
jgi:hypothetical protein